MLTDGPELVKKTLELRSDLTYNQNLKREYPDTAGKDLQKVVLGHDSIILRLYFGQGSN